MNARPPLFTRRDVVAWVLYDFAGSAYSAVITTAVFSVYFVRAIVGNEAGQGDLWWGRVISVSMLFVAITSPLLGAVADTSGARKKFLFFYTYLCIACVALFSGLERGMIWPAFLLATLANIGFEGALTFYNSYLPRLVPRDRQGTVSGVGFGIGYLGSAISLLLAIPLVTQERFDETWLMVAAFFAVFSLPAFRALPRDEPGQARVLDAAIAGVRGFRRIARDVLAYPALRRFLLAYFVYTDGVMTVIFFSGVYASETLGFAQADLIRLFLVVQISALIGALALARATDVLGPRRVIRISLVFWTLIVIGAYFVEERSTFFIISMIAGLGLGVVQASSRALMSSLIPAGKESEYFGFYAFCGKSSSILGPLLFGTLSLMTGGNQRIAIVSVGVFFLLGLVLLGSGKAVSREP